ncbi:phospholipid-binding protein MlaC [Aquisalimonas sp.]|uniref:MlaC/ttg2D family ABC transporter substrate-binding protein n=1 Tax=Aquisalimonas sp. TaxID=1872621 RepID=UPI0025C31FB8|nr:ABC transporter substrate-binding protein [Aquisalimonas sp.]
MRRFPRHGGWVSPGQIPVQIKDEATMQIPHAVLRPLVLGLILLWSAVAVAKSPEAMIKESFNASLDALMEHHEAIAEDPTVGEELIDEILGPRVHFELMSRLILGRYWNQADAQQQERFVSAFRRNVIRTYSRMLADNIDDAIEMVAGEDEILRVDRVTGPDDRGRATVRTTLRFSEASVPVHYRLIRAEDDDAEWLAYDVVIENISFVTNYRQEYSSAIRRDGVETLISRLEERNERARQRDG